MTVYYEWDIETVESGVVELDHAEIIDHYHHDKLSQMTDTLGFCHPDAAEQIRIVLVRDDRYGRQWAYIDGGRLPDEFDEGTTVPRRFQLEWDKYGEQINAQVDAINSGDFPARTKSNSAFLDKMSARLLWAS
jgi:hypothetical protein